MAYDYEGSADEPLRQLERDGFEVVHGHFLIANQLRFAPDPMRYWIWLREPVDRVLSEYFYLLGRRATSDTLVDYVKRSENRNRQSRMIAPFRPEDLSFFGLTEEMDAVLTGAGGDGLRRNVTPEKWDVDGETRDWIAQLNARDIDLYAHAKGLPRPALPKFSPP
jgi:hypothetical protein